LFLTYQCPVTIAQEPASTGLAPAARDYLNQVLDLIEKSSVKRDTKWDEFRRLTIEKAGPAKTSADTYPAIKDALKRLGDNHSELYTPEDLKMAEAGRAAGTRADLGIRVKGLVVVTVYPNGSASNAGVAVRDKVVAVDGNALSADSDFATIIKDAKGKGAKGVELTLKRENAASRKVPLEFGSYDMNVPLAGRLVSKDIGLIELPTFGGNFADQQKAMEEASRFAESVQNLIRNLDQGNLAGWIIDLRVNNGGNMWAMLAGVGPILGEGEAGGFVSARGTVKWVYRDGQAMVNAMGNNSVTTSVATPYKVRNENLPVVILTDDITASSAEAVVIAFKGRPKTRFIGMPTRGVPTGNFPIKLSDGAVLNLTTVLEADRMGKTYDGKIAPDIEMMTDWALYATDDEPVLKAAMKWIKSQK